MRHIDKQECTDGVCDFAEARPVSDLRIRREAGDDHLWLVLRRKSLDLVVVDQAGVMVDAVRNDIEQLAREIDGRSVRQVTTFIQAHSQDRVARLNQRMVDGAIGLRTRMRLHVGVVGTEQLFRPLDCQRFHIVDKLAAAVVTLAGIAFGVLVGQLAALRRHHQRTRVVLRGDQLDVFFLTLTLQCNGFGYFRIEGLDRLRGVEHPAFLRGRGLKETGILGYRTPYFHSKVTGTFRMEIRCPVPSGLDEGLHHAGPGAGQVLPVVPSTTRSNDAPLAVFIGQSAQRCRGIGVGLLSPGHVRDRVALQAVSTALHEDELGLLRIDKGLHPVPGTPELDVIGARRLAGY